jgi:hypothetical protein
MLKEFIEKQYFIVNFDKMDIADVMFDTEGQNEEEIKRTDIQYLDKLLEEDGLNISSLKNSRAKIKFNREERALYITLGLNNRDYKLSLLDFLEYDKYKKLTQYFLAETEIVFQNVSYQIGGIIDKNYDKHIKI